MSSAGPAVGVALRYAYTVDPVAVVAIAQAAEDLGFHSIWLSEHTVIPRGYASRYPFSDNGRPPFTDDVEWAHATIALGFVAASTRRIRLATSVIPMLTRSPLGLAREAATLDTLSGGRFELGLGAGWLKEEAEVLGRPTDHPGARMAEAIEIMQKAWSGATFEHRGRFWRVPELIVSPPPPQGAALPIWIGGVSPVALRTTVERAVGNIVVGDSEHVRSVAARLRASRPEIKICSGIRLHADDVAELALARSDAGADMLVLQCDGTPSPERTGASVRRLEWFAREVSPRLASRPARP